MPRKKKTTVEEQSLTQDTTDWYDKTVKAIGETFEEVEDWVEDSLDEINEMLFETETETRSSGVYEMVRQNDTWQAVKNGRVVYSNPLKENVERFIASRG